MAKLRVLLLCTLLATAAVLASQTGAPAMPKATTPKSIDRTVNVGPCKLHFTIIKGGPLTILLEAGGGMDSSEWAALAPRLAQVTGATVVAYDRAGFGQSSLPDVPCDIKVESRWLWQGLDRLGLARNVVLVGHSYGGMMIRAEAAERLAAVRGMVFIDPFTVEFVDQLGIDYCSNHPMLGKLPFDIAQPEKLSKDQRAMVRMVGAPGSNLAEKVAAVRQALIPAGIPLRLLTSGRDWLPEPKETKAWRQAHERLAASLSSMKLLVVDSDHMIPFRQPELIVETIAEVCEPGKAQQPANGKKKTMVGIDGGWALGGRDESSGHYYEKNAFALYLGVKIGYELSRSFALQFRMGVQTLNHKMEWGSNPWDLLIVSLNGVLNLKKTNRQQTYLLFGGGPCFGRLPSFNSVDFNRQFLVDFVYGGGVRFFLKPVSRSAINLEMAIHYLANLQKTSFQHDQGYMRLGVGFEF